MAESFDFKVVVLGATSVGKTSLIYRYCNGTFLNETISTIGAAFFAHTLVHCGKEVTLMLWDTAGEERFRSVAPSLLRGASGIVLVFDVQSYDTFRELDIYMDLFLDMFEVNDDAELPVILLGNKIDLEKRDVSDDKVREWMNRNRVTHFRYVCAKTGEGVDEAFMELVEVLLSDGNVVKGEQLRIPNSRQSTCC